MNPDKATGRQARVARRGTELHAINNYGVIVGEFTDKNGHIHGFKAVLKK